MPFIGPFLQSMNPKFEEYHAKWMSGELSCVSVFHKYRSRSRSARVALRADPPQIRRHRVDPRHGAQSLQLAHLR